MMIYEKWKGRILILLTTALAVWLLYHRADAETNVEGKVLRFHVIANSDSEADQALKYQVKNILVEALKPMLSGAEDLADTKVILQEKLPDIRAIAEEAVAAYGNGEDIQVELTNMYFPMKSYGELTFPAGYYDALRVTIGQAEGKNWWCVLFPNLCFMDVVHGVMPEESKEQLKNVLTEEEYESLFQWGKSPYRIRWRFLEFFTR